MMHSHSSDVRSNIIILMKVDSVSTLLKAERFK